MAGSSPTFTIKLGATDHSASLMTTRRSDRSAYVTDTVYSVRLLMDTDGVCSELVNSGNDREPALQAVAEQVITLVGRNTGPARSSRPQVDLSAALVRLKR
jgi:hypothetical protein